MLNRRDFVKSMSVIPFLGIPKIDWNDYTFDDIIRDCTNSKYLNIQIITNKELNLSNIQMESNFYNKEFGHSIYQINKNSKIPFHYNSITYGTKEQHQNRLKRSATRHFCLCNKLSSKEFDSVYTYTWTGISKDYLHVVAVSDKGYDSEPNIFGDKDFHPFLAIKLKNWTEKLKTLGVYVEGTKTLPPTEFVQITRKAFNKKYAHLPDLVKLPSFSKDYDFYTTKKYRIYRELSGIEELQEC